MSANDEDDETVDACLRKELPIRDVPAIVGSNLKRLRKDQGHSLERLAELSGVSRAMLGQIETGKSVPTVSLLWKVADALGVPVSSLIAVQNDAMPVLLEKARAPVFTSPDGGISRRPLFPLDRFRGAEFYELRIRPGMSASAGPEAAGTRQNLVVTRGTLRLTLGGAQAVVLTEGDAILFDADVGHTYENTGSTEVLAYLVLTHRPSA